jgi:hypothetical protein
MRMTRHWFGSLVVLFALVVATAPLTGCSSTNGKAPSQAPTSSTSTTAKSSSGSATGSARITVDGHSHTFSGAVTCTSQPANPNATPPRGNTEISAQDEAASLTLSWSANAASPLIAMSFDLKADVGEYRMPRRSNPPQVDATTQDNSYTVKGTPPVIAPGEGTMKNLPVEIEVTCA